MTDSLSHSFIFDCVYDALYILLLSPYSAEMDFSRQNLTSVDVRF